MRIKNKCRSNSKVRILVFGDSNAFRSDGGNTCWATLLEDKDPVNLNIVNESYDGRTTKYDTGERNGLGVIGNKLACHAPLDYVIVALGTNDAKIKYGPPDAAAVADGVSQILDFIGLYGGGAKSILMTPPPLGHVTSGDLTGAQSRISSVAVAYRSLAERLDIPLIDLHAILNNSTDLNADRIHLSAAGKQKVADAAWTTLRDTILVSRREEDPKYA